MNVHSLVQRHKAKTFELKASPVFNAVQKVTHLTYMPFKIIQR